MSSRSPVHPDYLSEDEAETGNPLWKAPFPMQQEHENSVSPFIPCSVDRIHEVLSAVASFRNSPTMDRECVCDIGSGDGRFVIEACVAWGCRGIGVELDSSLVAKSNAISSSLGLRGMAEFYEYDLLAESSPSLLEHLQQHRVSIVFCYLLPDVLSLIEERLAAFLCDGNSRLVISVVFHFKSWTPAFIGGEHKIFIYNRSSVHR